ncbi:unnamed protein product [Peronospora destructor]|uniref:poly(ADP-ribose) glycohydrolase n=1 Tax=Peronospora destructor TaxID=86335 RepID=A0AAV0TC46_9STRA|nr:unnamed protein product [Peronospora destructor]
MSCVLSLRGAIFAFHCLSPSERQELTALILHTNGKLYSKANARKRHIVYVITSFWADCKPTAEFKDISLQFVTSFWLHEMLRLRCWLDPGSNQFFEPPPRPKDLWLHYPVEYQDVEDVEKDTDMQDTSLNSMSLRVRLPCSPTFRFRGKVPLWPYIAAYLAQPIHDVYELTARLQLMTLSHPRRRFNCLEYAMNELLTMEEQDKFFKHVLPEMTRIVLALPQMFATPPPLLIPYESGGQVKACSDKYEAEAVETRVDANKEAQVMAQSHRFSKLQVLTLICGCFFGIFPDQDVTKSELGLQSRNTGQHGNNTGSDLIRFPHFTAVRLFSTPGTGKMVVLKGQKIRCLLQYFLRVVPLAVSKRNALSAEDVFRKENVLAKLKVLRIHSPQLHAATCVSGARIEDLGKHLQIDFANKFAGGGVFNSGCVQEEIRFLLSPELLVSCLLFAKLEPHEAFAVHGAERYSTYQGYGGSYVYGGNFEDTTPLESLPDGRLRRQCVVVGMDATDYGTERVQRQYTRGYVLRDLVKACAGFAYSEASGNEHCWPVASGNWGCGVFQGDRELKFLIQWLAASLCHRELVYALFERDLDLQTKVNTLLTLATSLKSHEWDQQSGGVIQWLLKFVLDELNFDRGMKGGHSVLKRASLSLERALMALQAPDSHQQITESKPKESQAEKAASSQTNLLSPDTKLKDCAIFTRREEQPDETMKKKPKVMKTEFHQSTMLDFCTPKQ